MPKTEFYKTFKKRFREKRTRRRKFTAIFSQSTRENDHFPEQDHIGRVDNALDLRPKDREFESYSSKYFFPEGGVSDFFHHVCV